MCDMRRNSRGLPSELRLQIVNSVKRCIEHCCEQSFGFRCHDRSDLGDEPGEPARLVDFCRKPIGVGRKFIRDSLGLAKHAEGASGCRHLARGAAASCGPSRLAGAT